MAKKIMIVDDEQDICDYLKVLFESHGYETVIATDGVEALALVKAEVPDLITLDLQMPNDTGTDFYRKLFRLDDLKAIPIIVISGIAGRHLAIRKPLAVLDKPIDKDKLMELVANAIG